MTLRYYGLNDRALGISARQLKDMPAEEVVAKLARAAAVVRKRRAQLDSRNNLTDLFDHRAQEIERRIRRIGRRP